MTTNARWSICAAFAALVLSACIPPPATSGGGEAPARAAASGGGGGTCDGACARVVECSFHPDDGSCNEMCEQGGYDPAMLGDVERGTCEQIAQILENASQDGDGTYAEDGSYDETGSGDDTGGGGGNAAVTCTAQGVYEVCDGTLCQDKSVESLGAGANQAAASTEAQQQCSSHMTQMTLISNGNGSASIKQTCRVVSCR